MPLNFLNPKYLDQIRNLRSKFTNIEEDILKNLLENIEDILKKKYGIVASRFKDDLIPSTYSNPYSLDKEADFGFFIDRLIEQLLLISFIRIDNLFNHLVRKLDDKDKRFSFSNNVQTLASKLGLSKENEDQLRRFGEIRNAMAHNNGLHQTGSLKGELASISFKCITELLNKVVGILRKILFAPLILEFDYIPDKAAEKWINQQNTEHIHANI